VLRTYGVALTEHGVLEKAIVVFNKAIAIVPNDVKTLSSYSKVLRKKGDIQELLSILTILLKIEPDKIRTQTSYIIESNRYAKVLIQKYRHEEAFELFERSLKLQPDNIFTLNSYANALVEKHRYEEAFEIFERSLLKKPEDIITLNRYANALVEKHRYEEAFELFKRSLQLQPDNVITLNNYANALIVAGRYKEAFDTFEKALQIEPDNAITLTSYGKALARIRKYNKAFDFLEQALELQPNNRIVLTIYAEELTSFGNYEKACALFERLLKIKADDEITIKKYMYFLKNYGLTFLKQGEYSKACKFLHKYLTLKKNNFILFKYARSLEELGKHEEAISQLETIDLYNLPQYHANVIRLDLGRLYYRIDKKGIGYRYFEEAIANSDDKERTLLYSARSILATNPYSDTAVQMLQQIAKESPRYAEALEMLTLNFNQEDYFGMVSTIDSQSGLSDTEMLNRAMYHKIANEVVILKSIASRILHFSESQDPLLSSIIKNIEDVSKQIDSRKAEQKSKIAEIPDDDYGEILAIISNTAHDISDFVNNELATIKSKTQRAMRKLQSDTPQYSQFNKLLAQLELTQAALNDLKAINEGITIKPHRFLVKKLFEKWEANPKIDRASIYLDIQNANREFEGDEEKIKSALQELVENSLKHNANKSDLEIHITSKDVVNPPGIRGYNIPGEEKYLSIEFSDNGKGVPDDKKDWIFQPLKTTSPEGKGSGLGLFIIRKTLAKMNAYIRESGNQGVKFEIFIPYKKDNNFMINYEKI
jgi:tetratricopeptide (TPR) repeat protein